MKDFYYILGLDSNCTLDEIKEAFRKLSKKFHPDLNQGDAYFENRFREINEAYETLSDPGKRSRYDKALKKFKANPIDEEFQRRQHNREQAANQSFHAASASFQRYKRKDPGIGITVAFILVALIIGVYLVESLGNSKAHKVSSASVVKTVSNKSHKHHKKKHNLTIKNAGDSSEHNTVNAVAKPAQSTLIIKRPVIADNNKQPEPVSNSNTSNNGSFLYATFVRANITGVVNLRKYADYNSPVIEAIPANSKVLVMEKGDIYYKVSYNNMVGYVPKRLLH